MCDLMSWQTSFPFWKFSLSGYMRQVARDYVRSSDKSTSRQERLKILIMIRQGSSRSADNGRWNPLIQRSQTNETFDLAEAIAEMFLIEFRGPEPDGKRARQIRDYVTANLPR